MAARKAAFRAVVEALKARGKTVTVVESTCGGLISASLMGVEGSSAVYYGGSVAYNTAKAKPVTKRRKAWNLPKPMWSNASFTSYVVAASDADAMTMQTTLLDLLRTHWAEVYAHEESVVKGGIRAEAAEQLRPRAFMSLTLRNAETYATLAKRTYDAGMLRVPWRDPTTSKG